ncbi:hypothetical protein [Parvularcula sp. LCG005]|uniref:hypothetical protein n=1 Tax=Parvularcula sp. LCG005 TaxID=3078805 RepID=UPI002943C819|nr:hypothetical protein [Parvularcula sp. LCG005]WOI52257.1 hypothetical protein RUI03_08840 [Parvularcula sp. LCG005]
MDVSFDRSAHFLYSSRREQLIEHLFLAELLRALWLRRIYDAEVLKAEVDAAGYDVVVEVGGVLRHIQLKSRIRSGRASAVTISTALSAKPSGCVLWILFEAVTMTLGPFLFFGGGVGEKLPDLGDRTARHTKADSTGHKAERSAHRRISKSKFETLNSMDEVIDKLFLSPAETGLIE